MKYIGGYFELETNLIAKNNKIFHSNAVKLASGRGCLSYILDNASIKKIWLPFYCCDSVINPFKEKDCDINFYEIGPDLLPLNKNLISQKDSDWILVINYFGLQNTENIITDSNHNKRLIIDNSMAFFANLSDQYWSFNSCRKFFGVPDGAYLMGPGSLEQPLKINTPDLSHLLMRASGKVTEGYALFQKAEMLIPDEPLSMSELSSEILAKINYQEVIRKRINNFYVLHSMLKSYNQLSLNTNFSNSCPQYYPLLLKKNFEKNLLIKKNIFTPTLWQECITRSPDLDFYFSRRLASHTLFLPIDHRYESKEMDYMANIILDHLD